MIQYNTHILPQSRYVLSPTHLHEFKSADHIYSQSPVMSLLLSDQKLGSHSQPGSSSHKFMLKGRQTGSMHRGHSWVFRAETYDTMLAWYEDIRNLTEKTGEERNAFVRKHARSFSQGSHRASSISGDSVLEEDDEADEVPFSAAGSVRQGDGITGLGGGVDVKDQAALAEQRPKRPEPGGRFPSDLNVMSGARGLREPSSGSSEAGQYGDVSTQPATATQSESYPPREDLSTVAGGGFPLAAAAGPATVKRDQVPNNEAFETYPPAQQRELPPVVVAPTPQRPGQTYTGPETLVTQAAPPAQASALPPSQDPFLSGAAAAAAPQTETLARHSSNYAGWMAPAATAGVVVGGAAGVVGAEKYWAKKREDAEALQYQREQQKEKENEQTPLPAVVADGKTSPAAEAGVLPLPPTQHTTSSSLPTEPVAPTSPVEPILATPITSTSINRSDARSILSNDTAATELTESPPRSSHGLGEGESHTKYDTNPDGSVNAHRTGRGWPILRHDTDVSVSNLHVPGEFPRGSTGGGGTAL